jgi:4-amino-4-deoxychorismate lyase
MANVFFKIKGRWLTPAIDSAGVKGIIRQNLLQQFSEKIIVQNIDRDSLTEVESAFMTNSLLGLVPIIELNQQALKDCQSISTFIQFVRQLRD